METTVSGYAILGWRITPEGVEEAWIMGRDWCRYSRTPCQKKFFSVSTTRPIVCLVLIDTRIKEAAMSLSLVIFEGSTPEQSIPLLATKDPTIIAFVRQLLWSRLQDRALKAQTHDATPHRGSREEVPCATE